LEKKEENQLNVGNPPCDKGIGRVLSQTKLLCSHQAIIDVIPSQGLIKQSPSKSNEFQFNCPALTNSSLNTYRQVARTLAERKNVPQNGTRATASKLLIFKASTGFGNLAVIFRQFRDGTFILFRLNALATWYEISAYQLIIFWYLVPIFGLFWRHDVKGTERRKHKEE